MAQKAHQVSPKTHKRQNPKADSQSRPGKAAAPVTGVPAPLDVQELVKEFTKVTTRLIAQFETQPVPQQQIATIVRQSVFDALRTRKQHHALIIEIDRLVSKRTPNSMIRERMQGWLARAGLHRIEELDSETKGWFVVLNSEDDGDCVSVVHPAYVDANTRTLVSSGQLKRIEHLEHGRKEKCMPFAELIGGTQETADVPEGE